MKFKFYLFSIIFSMLMLAGCGGDNNDYVVVVSQIEGTVIDSETSMPIPSCEVISSNYGTKLTDANGRFVFNDVNLGNVTLTYKAYGYEPLTRQISVTSSNTVTADASLKPDPSVNTVQCDKTVLDFGNSTSLMSFTLKNNSSSAIDYSIKSNADWITANPAASKIEAGREAKIDVSVNRESLSDGSYKQILTVETTRSSFDIQVLVDKGVASRAAVATESVAQSSEADNAVIAKGSITRLGNSIITKYGFCYAIGADPTLEENAGSVNLGQADQTKNFSSTLSNLQYDKEYHIRAYAVDQAGTSYGEVLKITLKKKENTNPNSISLSTSAATNVKATSATLNGSLTAKGNAQIREVGFYYGTTSTPSLRSVVNTYSTPVWVLDLNFNNDLDNLKEKTKYYYCAYAIDNNNEVIRGNVQAFTTLTKPSITLNSISFEYDGYPWHTYYVKASGTISKEGVSVVEVGLIYSSYNGFTSYEEAKKSYSGGIIPCEINGNNFYCDAAIDEREGHVSNKSFFNAYMILSDGTILYSYTTPLAMTGKNRD